MKGWGFQHSLNSIQFISLCPYSQELCNLGTLLGAQNCRQETEMYIYIYLLRNQMTKKISNFSSGQCFHFLAIHWPTENRLRSMFHCCKISHRRLRKQLHCSKVSPHTYSVRGEADSMSDENYDSSVLSLH